MKQIIFIVLICGLSSLVLVSCHGKANLTNNMPHKIPNKFGTNVADSDQSSLVLSKKSSDIDVFLIRGTVVQKNIEGGFFAIDGDDGEKYDPINLPASFRKNGLRVKIVARENKDVMTIHMYGTIIEIIDIEAQ